MNNIKTKVVNPTEEHFELFKQECRKWIEFFGITDWSVAFQYHVLGNHEAACIYRNADGMEATIVLNSEWGEFPEEFDVEWNIKIHAFHEVVHLLIGRLSSYGNKRFIPEEFLDQEEEAFVRRMERAIFMRHEATPKDRV